MAKGYNRYVKFSWNISSYFPDILKDSDLTDKQLRREYSRLRDVARKRIIRMGKTEFKRTKFWKKWKTEIPKLAELKNRSDVAHALSDVARFLTSAIGSIPGMEEYRRREVESLQASGFSFITEANFLDFAEFMDWLEDEGGKDFYPSRTMGAIQEGLERGHNFDKIKEKFEKHMPELLAGKAVPEWTEEDD